MNYTIPGIGRFHSLQDAPPCLACCNFTRALIWRPVKKLGDGLENGDAIFTG